MTLNMKRLNKGIVPIFKTIKQFAPAIFVLHLSEL
jgi:hypothetical protein